MGRSVVRQPDGKLAVFDSVGGRFTAYDNTPTEALDHLKAVMLKDGFLETAAQADATDMVQRGMEDIRPSTIGIKGAGLERWNEMLEAIHRAHGRQGLEDALNRMGFAGYDISALDLDAEAETAPRL